MSDDLDPELKRKSKRKRTNTNAEHDCIDMFDALDGSTTGLVVHEEDDMMDVDNPTKMSPSKDDGDHVSYARVQTRYTDYSLMMCTDTG